MNATSGTAGTMQAREIALTELGASPSQWCRIETSWGPRSRHADVLLVQAEIDPAHRDEVDLAKLSLQM